jgi:hypothetical protein
MEETKRRDVGIDLRKREYTMAIIGKNERTGTAGTVPAFGKKRQGGS